MKRKQWMRGWALGVCGATLLITTTGFAQTGPEITITVTGKHRRTEGIPVDNALMVQIGISPTSSRSTSEPSIEQVDYVPTQVEAETESTPYSDVPLDPMERDEAPSSDASKKRSSRYRDALTKSGESENMEFPFVFSASFAQAAVSAAIAAQGVDSALSRLESLAKRSRTSAFLPEVRFRAGRNTDQALRLAPTDDDPFRYTQTGGVSYVVEGAATFRLNRLLFASEELGIERLRLAEARERQRMTAMVLERLVDWQDAYQLLLASETRPSRVWARLSEASLALDLMTSGWFSEHKPQLPSRSSPSSKATDARVPAAAVERWSPRKSLSAPGQGGGGRVVASVN